MYKVESDFMWGDYRCVVIFTSSGYRCGYVGVPRNNGLYGKEYTDFLDIPLSTIEDQPIGKRGIMPLIFSAMDNDEKVRMDMFFDVHGSLTFSGDGHHKYPVESDLWWFGFDCGHYNDGKDLDLVEKYWGNDENIQRKLEIERKYPTTYDGEVRSKEYVEKECKSLVSQILGVSRNTHENTTKFAEWLSTFNTESATECFTAVQELKKKNGG